MADNGTNRLVVSDNLLLAELQGVAGLNPPLVTGVTDWKDYLRVATSQPDLDQRKQNVEAAVNRIRVNNTPQDLSSIKTAAIKAVNDHWKEKAGSETGKINSKDKKGVLGDEWEKVIRGKSNASEIGEEKDRLTTLINNEKQKEVKIPSPWPGSGGGYFGDSSTTTDQNEKKSEEDKKQPSKEENNSSSKVSLEEKIENLKIKDSDGKNWSLEEKKDLEQLISKLVDQDLTPQDIDEVQKIMTCFRKIEKAKSYQEVKNIKPEIEKAKKWKVYKMIESVNQKIVKRAIDKLEELERQEMRVSNSEKISTRAKIGITGIIGVAIILIIAVIVKLTKNSKQTTDPEDKKL